MKRKIKKTNRPPKKLSNAVKKKIKEDAFWDGDKNVNADDAVIINPSRYDVQSEVSAMDSFRDFAREHRGNGLTYGDY
jgi:hypothetical protein